MTLCELFAKYGTDKNTIHSYGPIYEELLAPIRESARVVLELGVYEGESIRAWRDYFPNAIIVGMDCDDRRMKDDGRVIFVRGESQRPEHLDHLPRGPYDLIVDDGDHLPGNQFLAATYLLQLLAPGGIYVVEDLRDVCFGSLYEPMGGKLIDRRHVKCRHDDIMVVIRR